MNWLDVCWLVIITCTVTQSVNIYDPEYSGFHCPFSFGEPIASQTINITDSNTSKDCFHSCIDYKLNNTNINVNGVAMNTDLDRQCRCLVGLKRIRKQHNIFHSKNLFAKSVENIYFKYGQPISSESILISNQSMSIKECFEKCKVRKESDNSINAVTVKSNEIRKYFMVSNAKTSICKCERKMKTSNGTRTCMIHSLSDKICTFREGIAVKEKSIFVKATQSEKECAEICQELQKEIPQINGVTWHMIKERHCACELGMISRQKYFTCMLHSTGERGSFQKGKYTSDSSIALRFKNSTGITADECVRQCQEKKKKDGSIDSVTVQDFQKNERCWCNQNTTKNSRYNFNSCYLNNDTYGYKKMTETNVCKFELGRPVSGGRVDIFSHNSQINQTECFERCRKKKEDITDINGITMKRGLNSFCSCQKNMVNRQILYTCKFDKDDKCKLTVGEGISSEYRTIGISGITEEKCAEQCKYERDNVNKNINGMSVNGLFALTICHCHINLTEIIAYKSCFLKDKIVTESSMNIQASSGHTKIQIHPTFFISNSFRSTEPSVAVAATTQQIITEATKSTESLLAIESIATVSSTSEQMKTQIIATEATHYNSTIFLSSNMRDSTGPFQSIYTSAPILRTSVHIAHPTETKKTLEENLLQISPIFKNVTVCTEERNITEPCASLSELLRVVNAIIFNTSVNEEKTITVDKENKHRQMTTAKIVKEIVNLSNDQLTEEIAPLVVEIIDNMMSLNNSETIQEDKAFHREIAKVLQTSMEIMIKKLASDKNISDENKVLKVSTKNVGLVVRVVNNSQPLLISTTTTTKGIDINIETIQQNARRKSSNEVEELSKIKLPTIAFSKSIQSIVSVSYTSSFLFPTYDRNQDIGTIISAVVIGQEITENLYEPITLQFMKTGNNATDLTGRCSFWKELQQPRQYGTWSNVGCSKISETNHTITCECNHLTNFAVLFDISQTGYNPLALRIVTWVGCGISLACLSITVLSYLMSRQRRRRMQSKIIFKLSITLMLLLIVFLAGVERTEVRLGCRAIAVILHFLLLSTFCWMGVEGVNLYKNIVIIFNSKSSRHEEKFQALFAIGLPLLLALINAVMVPSSLGNESFCVVHGLSFYFALVVPCMFVLLINFVIFTMTLLTINNADRKTERTKTSKESIVRLTRVAMATSCLMGLTWIFGAIAIMNATVTFQWLFTVFNSLQGFFIFIFHIVRNKEAMKELKRLGFPDIKTTKTKKVFEWIVPRKEARSATTSKVFNFKMTNVRM